MQLTNRGASKRAWHQMLAFVHRVSDLRRVRLLASETVCAEFEKWPALGINGGVGPVRHPVRAHAAAESHHAGQQEPHFGWRELVVNTGREQVLAVGFGCLESGAAYPELLRARKLRVAIDWCLGVGKVRDAA